MDTKDIAQLLTALAAFISTITALVKLFRIRNISRVIKDVVFWIAVLLAIVFAVLFFWLITRPCIDPTKFGFENGEMGWIVQTYPDSQGVTKLAQSVEQAKICKHSLKLTLDLEGSHKSRSKGEVFVDIPVQDLGGKSLSVWVFIPKTAVGSITHPNGVQVFVKDNNNKSEYGTWWEITPSKTGTWQQVTLTPSSTAPAYGSMEDGFDPTHIKYIGVKFATSEGSKDKYNGSVYIDGFDWP